MVPLLHRWLQVSSLLLRWHKLLLLLLLKCLLKLLTRLLLLLLLRVAAAQLGRRSMQKHSFCDSIVVP